jgi:hypothetical protein
VPRGGQGGPTSQYVYFHFFHTSAKVKKILGKPSCERLKK